MNKRVYVHRPCFVIAIFLAIGICFGAKTNGSIGLIGLISGMVFVAAVWTRHKR